MSSINLARQFFFTIKPKRIFMKTAKTDKKISDLNPSDEVLVQIGPKFSLRENKPYEVEGTKVVGMPLSTAQHILEEGSLDSRDVAIIGYPIRDPKTPDAEPGIGNFIDETLEEAEVPA